MQQTAAAQCGDEQTTAIMRSAAAADRKKTLAAAAKSLLQLPADAADKLQHAVQACKQQLVAFDLVLRRIEGRTAPIRTSAAVTTAGVSAAGSSSSSGGGEARPLKQQKRALQQIQGRFDVDAGCSRTPFQWLDRARETAYNQVTAVLT
jgi:hypothetical protein